MIYIAKIGGGYFLVKGLVQDGLLHWTDEYKESGISDEFIPALPRDYSVKEKKTLWRKHK